MRPTIIEKSLSEDANCISGRSLLLVGPLVEKTIESPTIALCRSSLALILDRCLVIERSGEGLSRDPARRALLVKSRSDASGAAAFRDPADDELDLVWALANLDDVADRDRGTR